MGDRGMGGRSGQEDSALEFTGPSCELRQDTGWCRLDVGVKDPAPSDVNSRAAPPSPAARTPRRAPPALGLAQRKRASPRGEAGTSGFLCVSDSDRRVPAVLGLGWEGLGAGGEGDDRGRDGWMASLT